MVITELEAAKRLGVTRQTMRNWRCGYRGLGGKFHAPKLGAETWYKIGAMVVYDVNFVEELRGAKNNLDKVLAGAGVAEVPSLTENEGI